MEVTKGLQEKINNLQNQLKLSIKNHQIIVFKLEQDPVNVQHKKQLADLQKHIMSLCETQKRLIQQLRKEIDNSLPSISKPLVQCHESTTSGKAVLSVGPINNYLRTRDRPYSNCHGRPSSVTSSRTSEDSMDESEPVPQAEILEELPVEDYAAKKKLEFMSALGLVSRSVLVDVQNRRVERKKRSTANHMQFVYGKPREISRKKKGNYLVATATKEPTKAVAVDKQQSDEEAPPTPVSLRISGLPSSLTIERIESPPCSCFVCHKSGQLLTCSNCNMGYHKGCSMLSESGGDVCPQCQIKPEPGATISASMTIFQNFIGDKKHFAERLLEKEHLLEKRSKVNQEKEELEGKAAMLTASLAVQASQHKHHLETEERTRKCIKVIQDFITIVKSSPS